MKVGDLVVRTYGEGQRPVALLVGWYSTMTAEVIWTGSDRIVQFAAKHLETLDNE